MPEPDVAQNDDVKSCHNTITVILCTYNRCQSLSKALQSVAASRNAEFHSLGSPRGGQ